MSRTTTRQSAANPEDLLGDDVTARTRMLASARSSACIIAANDAGQHNTVQQEGRNCLFLISTMTNLTDVMTMLQQGATGMAQK